MEKVMNEVQSKLTLSPEEGQKLNKLLQTIETELNQLGLEMNFNQWIALSVHLVNLIRRIEDLDTVPGIDQSLWDQLSQQSIELSFCLLEPLKEKLEDPHYLSEVFLLAVHLEGASKVKGGE
ncbi:PRD domain-containing protein [Pullulanibacillus sp. KACC 23026]|uniref:PRD domain-containing protein n=1 Tax=Pullulanibacillus sp. KACC 23026 TaxID=3028315 RepID=UPI0023AF881B|nr:PRD domain-containing protein [Pullulanibacillus sp. KACC 23026]WEG11217.1 PRD domain-containing protein [Pullulanibacillus sp. KACC 23026]